MSSVPVTAPAGFPRSSVTTAPGGTVAVASEPPGASAGPSTGCATRRETLTLAGLVPPLKTWSVGLTPPPSVKPAIWRLFASADAPMESRPAASPLAGSTAEPNSRTCPVVTVQAMRAEASAGMREGVEDRRALDPVPTRPVERVGASDDAARVDDRDRPRGRLGDQDARDRLLRGVRGREDEARFARGQRDGARHGIRGVPERSAAGSGQGDARPRERVGEDIRGDPRAAVGAGGVHARADDVLLRKKRAGRHRLRRGARKPRDPAVGQDPLDVVQGLRRPGGIGSPAIPGDDLGPIRASRIGREGRRRRGGEIQLVVGDLGRRPEGAESAARPEEDPAAHLVEQHGPERAAVVHEDLRQAGQAGSDVEPARWERPGPARRR